MSRENDYRPVAVILYHKLKQELASYGEEISPGEARHALIASLSLIPNCSVEYTIRKKEVVTIRTPSGSSFALDLHEAIDSLLILLHDYEDNLKRSSRTR